MKPTHEEVLLVHFENGQVEPYDVRTVVNQLAQDPLLIDLMLRPWLIEAAVECLVHHFRKATKHKQVSLAEFIETTRELLEGFAAETRRGDPGDRQMDLFATARRPGFGFELEFFNRVREFLKTNGEGLARRQPSSDGTAIPGNAHEKEAVMETGTIRITGLNECVKFLMGHRHWNRRCAQLRDEIIAFIRQEMMRGGRNSPVVVIVS